MLTILLLMPSQIHHRQVGDSVPEVLKQANRHWLQASFWAAGVASYDGMRSAIYEKTAELANDVGQARDS